MFQNYILQGCVGAVEYSESLRLWTFSIFRDSKYVENKMFRKINLFLFSGEGREASTLLGPLERANFSH
jgi:hypothetical protein